MDSLILGLRVAVALGAVLGLIWLLQRRLGKGTGRRRADAALSVVSRQSVGQRASVVVVDAGGQRFLLGVTDHAVNVLHTGDIPEEPAEAPAPEPRRGGAAGAFAQILASAGFRRRLGLPRPPGPVAGCFRGHRPAAAAAGPAPGTPERPAVPAQLHPPRIPRPDRPGPRHHARRGPPAAARVDPGRFHLEAGRRRSQERTPQLIRPATAAPPASRHQHQPTRHQPASGRGPRPRRRAAAPSCCSGSTRPPATPPAPVAAGSAHPAGQPGQRQRQH